MFAVPQTLPVKPVLGDVDRDEALLRPLIQGAVPVQPRRTIPAFPSETGEARVNVEP